MRIVRIYHSESITLHNPIALSDGAVNHLARALRFRVGDLIHLFDGHGGEYKAVIDSITKKQVLATPVEFIALECESPLNIHLGQGIARGEKMDLILQKAVELGVHAITPLFTEHCNVQLSSERIEKRMHHWQGIIASACEQCGRNRLPQLHTPQSFVTWIQQQHADLKIILHPDLTASHQNADNKINSITMVVGPEGGFAEPEIKLALKHGFHTLTLGPRILRTETAGLVALSVLQYRFGDLGSN